MNSPWGARRRRPRPISGFAYERRGDMANAYEQYLEAARLDPHSRRARLNLAHAATLTGHATPAAQQRSETSSETSVNEGSSSGVARRGVGPMKSKDPMHVPRSASSPVARLRAAIAVLLLVSAGLAGGGGCADRTYLTKSHGRAYAEAFDRQVVNPIPRRGPPTDRGTRRPSKGWTRKRRPPCRAHTATAFQERTQWRKGTGRTWSSPNPGAAPPTGYMPAPSVPNNQ